MLLSKFRSNIAFEIEIIVQTSKFFIRPFIFIFSSLCWLGILIGGCSLLEHSLNPLGSLSIQYGFGLDRIEGSYPT